jgi:SAM-dependent methyltransferase
MIPRAGLLRPHLAARMVTVQGDADRWNERYAAQAPPMAAVPEALRRLIDVVPTRGTALDVACGAGAQTLWLAGRGLDVVALDVSPVAIGLLIRAADRAGLGERVHAGVADLDDGLPDDLGRFEVVLCQRFRQPSLYGPLVDHVADGGIAALTVLSEVGLDDAPGPFHAPEGELLTLADRPDVDVIDHTEHAGLASLVLRRRRTTPFV